MKQLNTLEKIAILNKNLELIEEDIKKEYNRVEKLYEIYSGEQLDSFKVWNNYNSLNTIRMHLITRINDYNKTLK